MIDEDGEQALVLGTVLEDDRGSLPFVLIHGEALVTCAAWALGEAGVRAVDVGTSWEQVVESGAGFVLHDPLCPMTPSGFITDCVERALVEDVVVVGVRPVTDTVKQVVADASGRALVGATVDRDGLVALAAPVVLPPSVVAALLGPPSADLVRLVAELRAAYDVVLVEAPPAARRVTSEEDVRVLEALTAG